MNEKYEWDNDEWPDPQWTRVHTADEFIETPRPPINFQVNPAIDAIIVPGGGVLDDGTVTPWVKARLDASIEYECVSRFIITLSRGTTHRRPVIIDGHPILEADAGARYLLENGIPTKKIISLPYGLDTIGDAYFARLHTGATGLRKILVITSAFQLKADTIFDIVYDMPPMEHYSMHFLMTPNVGLCQDSINTRIEREKQGLRNFDDLLKRIKTFSDLSSYLYSSHEAYRVEGKSEILPKTLLASYGGPL